MMLEY